MMNVDTVRKIDYAVGVPLCFLATLLQKLGRVLGIRPKRSPLKRVLLVELSEMGSAILVDPAMRWLKDQQHAELYFAIFKRNKPSLDLLKTVPEENIFLIRDTGILPLAIDSLKFLFWTRKNRIDTVIDLELFSRFTALLTGYSGAYRRVGFHAFHHEGLYRGEMLTHRVAYNPHIHIAKSFLALVHAAASDERQLPFTKRHFTDAETKLSRLTFTDSQRASMFNRVRENAPGFDPAKHRLVLINPNASELLPQRRWMSENYARLIQLILDASPDTWILITGAPSESAGAEALRKAANRAQCVNFAGKTTLSELTSLYDICSFMVTNDSGPAHFASVTGMHTFVLFGPETPKLYGSLGPTTPITSELACSPCVAATNHRKTVCTDPVCLKVITPEKVFDAVKSRLTEKRA
jgi:ADP-heptose:LPS heptosyltransferase